MTKAYKIVEKHEKGLKTLFHGVNGTRLLTKGRWIAAEEKWVTDGSSTTVYLSGWHVLLKKRDAINYLKSFKTRLDKLKIVPVYVREIRAKEHSPYPVFLAKELMLR